MKLKCENIGKLSSAEVEINTITLIAGLNSTGKSTIGKLLYSIFNTQYNLESQAKHKLETVLRRYIGEEDFIFEPSYEKVANCVKTLLDQRNKADFTSVKKCITAFMGEEFISSKKENFFSDIVEFLNLSNEVIYRSLLQNRLVQEFSDQIQNIYFPDAKSTAELTINNNDVSLVLEKNEVTDFKNLINLKTEVIYIDDPFVLDNLNGRPMYSSGHKYELIKKLRSSIEEDTNIEKVIKDLVRTKKIDNIYNKIDSACRGNLIHSPKDGFNLQMEGSNENLRLVNISTGLKAFVIIKTLLLNGTLEKKGTVILDEPEIHLHPEWQKLLAEIIVLIQKEFDMHILINSHSPYFINAIDIYTQKYKIRETCKFYLAKDTDKTGKTSELIDVSNNIEEINKLLFIPLQELENERSDIDVEDNDD